MFIEFIKKNQLTVSTIAILIAVASMSVSIFRSRAVELNNCTFSKRTSIETIAESGCNPGEVKIISEGFTGLRIGDQIQENLSTNLDKGIQGEIKRGISALGGSVFYNSPSRGVMPAPNLKLFSSIDAESFPRPYDILAIGKSIQQPIEVEPEIEPEIFEEAEEGLEGVMEDILPADEMGLSLFKKIAGFFNPNKARAQASLTNTLGLDTDINNDDGQDITDKLGLQEFLTNGLTLGGQFAILTDPNGQSLNFYFIEGNSIRLLAKIDKDGRFYMRGDIQFLQ